MLPRHGITKKETTFETQGEIGSGGEKKKKKGSGKKYNLDIFQKKKQNKYKFMTFPLRGEKVSLQGHMCYCRPSTKSQADEGSKGRRTEQSPRNPGSQPIKLHS